MKITEKEQQEIKYLEIEQNKRVFAYGIMSIQRDEYEMNYRKEKDRILDEIKAAEVKQKTVGEMILKAHGLNLEGRDLKINPDGEIVELKEVNGIAKFVSVEKEKQKIKAVK